MKNSWAISFLVINFEWIYGENNTLGDLKFMAKNGLVVLMEKHVIGPWTLIEKGLVVDIG